MIDANRVKQRGGLVIHSLHDDDDIHQIDIPHDTVERYESYEAPQVEKSFDDMMYNRPSEAAKETVLVRDHSSY